MESVVPILESPLAAGVDDLDEAPFSISTLESTERESAGRESAGRESARQRAVALRKKDRDKKLKEEFLAGSTDAFIQLYAKYEVPLLVYCKRMLRDEAAAEDAFQEIWTRIFELRNRKGIVIEHFRGLLFQSARNLCFNIMRVDRPHNAEMLDEITVDEVSTRETSQREIKDLMVRALSRLPFDQREIFVLHEYSGFSYGEIAEMMELKEDYVKVRAYRARLRLRKFIQGWLGLAETDDPVDYI